MNSDLAGALARLDAALDRLEGAASRHLDPEARRGDLEVELQVMGDDRARLATDLEGAAARIMQLETATDHVATRLAVAIGSIQTALGEAGGPPGHAGSAA